MADILLVDDDEQVRSVLKNLFEEEGYNVKEAEDGRIALEKFEGQLPDLVLTDIVMPDKEGLEIIRTMRRICPKVKIIAMSGGGGRNNPTDYLKLAKHFGADYVIAKPFNISDLLDLVSRALG